MGTGRTARYHWNFAICPTRVSIDLSVVRALEQDLAAAGDQQGFLLGKEQEAATHVNGREPFAGFTRGSVAAALAMARRPAVGYYRIREGSAFILTSEEIEIAKQLFRTPNSVVLLIERRAAGPAEATFFFWRGGSFVHNLPMPFTLDADRLAAADPAAAPDSEPSVVGAGWPVWQRIGVVGGAVAVGVACAAFLTLRMPAKTPAAHAVKPPVSAAAPASIAVAPGAAIEFVWDPKAMPAATAGLLEIADGASQRSIPLDEEQLRDGRISFQPTSNQIRAELSTLQRDGRIVDAAVSVRRAASASVRVEPPPAPPAPQAVVQQRPQSPAEPAEPPTPATPAPASGADRRVAAKRFNLVIRRAEESPAPLVLDPPPVEAPITSASLPIEPALRMHVPPPAPAAPAPVHMTASAGRLIWTGTLLRRGVVELEGRSASVGSISGALPGVPVRVSISPAEFEGDGLVVYTTDAARNNRVDPPSAANGWNRVKWVWDPMRVREIAVLEPPNASNGYSRLAFRNDARRTSMVWIDWQVRR